MLGFAPLGMLALGQPPAGTTFQLIGAVGSFILTGMAASFNVSLVPASGAYSLIGIATPFTVSAPETTGAFTLTGISAVFSARLAASPGTYSLTGNVAAFSLAAPQAAGSFAFAGIAQTMLVSTPPATGTYALTGIAIAPNGTGAFNLAGQAQTFSVVETNVFSSLAIPSQFGFAALGQVALGGAFTTILDPSFNLSGPYVNLQTKLAASPSAYQVDGAPVAQVWQLNGLTGSFNLTGISATFSTTWAVSPGAYVTSGYATLPNEQWAGRPDTPSVWTAAINDTGTTIISNAHFLFGALGSLALGQGIYNPRIFSEGWTARPSTAEIWAPIVNDVTIPDPFKLQDTSGFATTHGFRSTVGNPPRPYVLNPARNTLVQIVPGQSWGASYLPSMPGLAHGDSIYNFFLEDGNFYSSTVGPLLGTSYVPELFPVLGPGNAYSMTADGLIPTFHDVIHVPISVGGTMISQWGDDDGLYNDRAPVAMRRLRSRGITPTTPGFTFICILQIGITDYINGTTEAAWRASAIGFITKLLAAGFSGRIFIPLQSNTGHLDDNPIRRAQRSLWNGSWIFSGGDNDDPAITLADGVHPDDPGGRLLANNTIAAIRASGAPFI